MSQTSGGSVRRTRRSPDANGGGTARAGKAAMGPGKAFLELSRRITDYYERPKRLKDKHHALIEISEYLREAFCIRPELLEAVPKQLGANYDTAAQYIYDQVDLWGEHEALTRLFNAVDLDEPLRRSVVETFIGRIPVDDLAVWVSEEFGDLTATRHADHARRYIATRLSREIFDLSAAQEQIETHVNEALQVRLDRWSNRAAPIEQSLHYQMVIEPFIGEFEELARTVQD